MNWELVVFSIGILFIIGRAVQEYYPKRYENMLIGVQYMLAPAIGVISIFTFSCILITGFGAMVTLVTLVIWIDLYGAGEILPLLVNVTTSLLGRT